MRDVALLIALGLVVTCPVLIYGAPDLSHDALDHARWARQFATQFWSGDLYPRWFTNVNAGFGGPSGFFYPPLTSYVSTIFWPFVASHDPYGWLAAGYAMALAEILSALTAYWWLRSLVKPAAALAGAAVYAIAPYHLAVDLYVRGASAEAWLFVWFPLVLLAAEKLRNGSRWAIAGAAASYALAVLSHPTVALCFAPIPVAYVFLFSEREARLRATGMMTAALLLGVGLNAQYLLPAIFDQGKAYVAWQTSGPSDYRNQWLWQDNHEIGAMAQYVASLITRRSVQVEGSTLIKLPIAVGTVATITVFAVLCAWIARLRRTDRLRRIAVFYAVIGVGSVFLMTKFSLLIWRAAPFLKFLQFPWRLNVLLALSVALMAAVIASRIAFAGHRTMAGFAIVMVVCWLGLDVLACSQSSTRWRKPSWNREELTRQMERTQVDYPTMWPRPGNLHALTEFSALDRFVAAHPPQTGTLAPAPGQPGGTVQVESWRPRRVVLKIAAPGDSELTLNHFYYGGWQGRLHGSKIAIAAMASPDGLMQFAVARGEYEFVVELPQDGPERTGMWISLLSLALLGGATLMGRRLAVTRRAC